jgi:hypothetical protein
MDIRERFGKATSSTKHSKLLHLEQGFRSLPATEGTPSPLANVGRFGIPAMTMCTGPAKGCMGVDIDLRETLAAP